MRCDTEIQSKLEPPGTPIMLVLGLIRHDRLEHAALFLLQLLSVGLAIGSQSPEALLCFHGCLTCLRLGQPIAEEATRTSRGSVSARLQVGTCSEYRLCRYRRRPLLLWPGRTRSLGLKVHGVALGLWLWSLRAQHIRLIPELLPQSLRLLIDFCLSATALLFLSLLCLSLILEEL
jgi:hypothetical protein